MYKIENLIKQVIANNPKNIKELSLQYCGNNIIKICNLSNKTKRVNIARLFFLFKPGKALQFTNKGNLKQGACYFYISGALIPLDSTVTIALSYLKSLKIVLIVKPNTEITLQKLTYSVCNNEQENLSPNSDTLVISPGYPSSSNLYSFGFVHTSCKGYVDAGLSVDVFCPYNSHLYYQYQFDKSNITFGSLAFLKELISKSNYKRIIFHFFDEKFTEIIESVALYYGIKIYIYVHGADVLYHLQKKIVTGYDGVFRPYLDKAQVQKKDEMFRKYSKIANITWLFVSNWVKIEAEKTIKTQFINYAVISNGIDTGIFKYHKKTPKHRFNIFTIRKFDNLNNYALDLVVKTIHCLKEKDFFKDLNFYIYGDGLLFDEFADKAKFPNVKFTRGFFTHRQISKLHEECGIIFHPTRFDNNGCSSLEGICSGLVLVSSNTAAVPEFINPAYGTLSNDVEDPNSYASIIEDLYNNPEKFLDLSAGMLKDISSKFSRDIILAKELELFHHEKPFYIEPSKKAPDNRILSICIPSYNIEKYLTRCLNSILSCHNRHLLEIILINDGSTDKTLDVAAKFQNDFPEIIKIINQENSGHGTAVVTGINNATAKYFRIIDGDDWVDPEALGTLIDNIKELNVDLVLTEFCHDFLNKAELKKDGIYSHLPEKRLLNFDGLKFCKFGPVLATSTYKTSILKDANITLPEKCFYTDMEFNAYAIQNVNSVTYFKLFLYRYFIGRSSQSISSESFIAKYNDHEKVIFNLLNFVTKNKQLNPYKRKLITDKLLLLMLGSHFLNLIVNLKKYRKAINVYKKVINISRTNTYKINLPIITYAYKEFVSRYVLRALSRIMRVILLVPYNLAEITIRTLNMYDIYYFNKYIATAKKILLLPYRVSQWLYQKFIKP